MRILLLPLLVAACGREASPVAEAPTGRRIACAAGGQAEFRNTCSIVRSESSGRSLLTLSHADGGFRRVSVDSRGGALAAADGAEPARVASGPGGEIELSIAGDRYRLPAARP